MFALLSGPTSPWILANRLLHSDDGCSHGNEDVDSNESNNDGEGSAKVAYKLQSQAAALRAVSLAMAAHENASSSRKSGGRKFEGVQVGGWLADPVVAAAMLEAAAPASSLKPLLDQAARGSLTSAAAALSAASKGRPGRGGGKGSGGRSCSGSSAMARATRAARAAARSMAGIEPLLERFLLVEPFTLVEMPLVSTMAELATTGMALDWRASKRLRQDVEEQKSGLQRLVGQVCVQTQVFGGFEVKKEAEINLSSPKDVKEMLEVWNLPRLLRRKGAGGVGKTDTKSDTLQGYLDVLMERQANRRAAAAAAKAAKVSAAAAVMRSEEDGEHDGDADGGGESEVEANGEENEWEYNARRFLSLVLEYRRLDKLPASLLGLSGFAQKCPSHVAPPALRAPVPSATTMDLLAAPATEALTSPATAGTSLFLSVDRVVPEVVHARAEGNGSQAVNVGLATTGRVSVRPLQHVQKQVSVACIVDMSYIL